VSDKWYYVDDHGQVGPVTLQTLRETLATFSNPEDVLVWCERFQDWKPAGNVPELNALFPLPLPWESHTDNHGQRAHKSSYVASILQPGERVLSVGRLHWIIYMDAVIAFLFSIGCLATASLISSDAYPVGLWTLIVGLILLAMSALRAAEAWFDQWITEIAVTNRRVIYKRGFIKRHTVEMNMDKIESVTVTQSILGRTLDYGTIHIRGTGVGMEHLHKIAAPISLRNCITVR
jgi:GYF domain 2/Bacterial PH domain